MSKLYLLQNVLVSSRLEPVKPIFHCDAKSFALGTFASPNAKDSSFALPNARNTSMLVSFALGDAHFSRFTRHVLPDAFYPTRFTRRQSVEYRWRWAFWRWDWHWACIYHIFCVHFICVWWSTQSQYPVEYGLKYPIVQSKGSQRQDNVDQHIYPGPFNLSFYVVHSVTLCNEMLKTPCIEALTTIHYYQSY